MLAAASVTRASPLPSASAPGAGLLASETSQGAAGFWTYLQFLIILIMMVNMIAECPMITEVSAVNFRQNLGDMLNQVQYRNDSIVISKDGKPVAALVDAELFARIRRMQERFDALSARIADAYAGVPVAEGMDEIEAAVAAERKSR
jgi:prevent-host-death family protein